METHLTSAPGEVCLDEGRLVRLVNDFDDSVQRHNNKLWFLIEQRLSRQDAVVEQVLALAKDSAKAEHHEYDTVVQSLPLPRSDNLPPKSTGLNKFKRSSSGVHLVYGNPPPVVTQSMPPPAESQCGPAPPPTAPHMLSGLLRDEPELPGVVKYPSAEGGTTSPGCTGGVPDPNCRRLPELGEAPPEAGTKARRRSSRRTSIPLIFHKMVNHGSTKDNQWQTKIKRKLESGRPGRTPSTRHHQRVIKHSVPLTEHAQQMRLEKQTNHFIRFILSDRFEIMTSLLIVANCIYIGASLEIMTQSAKANLGQPVTEPIWTKITEAVFCSLFVVELALRLWAQGPQEFATSEDKWWNLFDFFVVMAGVIELIVDLSSDDENQGNTSTLRLMRAIRTTRAMRAVRMFRFFRELRMIICSILGSFKSLMWSLMMLILLFYIFGLAYAQVTYLECLGDARRHNGGCSELLRRFGSLPVAILSLFQSMSGGVDWDDIWQAMSPLPAPYLFMYLFYVFFTIFGVVNVVTGIFVDSAMEASKSDRSILVKLELQQQEKYLLEMQRLFEEIDVDGSGMIALEEFEKHLNDERALAYFESMKLDISEVGLLFSMIDNDSSGTIDMEEFIAGCQRLKGESRAMDLAIFKCEFENWAADFERFAYSIDAQIKALARKISDRESE
mmetsp:Transcript_43133/g.93978  ORF Transcript_43133/g.93978 Transcript_43133/m.93978 type:complete len:670 (-) Transcript_43133:144-2153(-)